MFDFRKISFEDKEWITKCLAVSDFRGAEYCFANNMAWQRLNDTVITHHGDFYISCSFEDGQPYFTFPAGVKIDVEGKEKYIRLFDELKEYVSAHGKPLIVSSVTDDNLSWIKEYYGDKIICEYDRDSSDYIYNASDLIELKGKKYHGKLNIFYVNLIKGNLACCGNNKTGQQINQSTFTTTRTTHQSNFLTRGNMQVKISQRFSAFCLILYGNIIEM
jgi:hypothetical protein